MKIELANELPFFRRVDVGMAAIVSSLLLREGLVGHRHTLKASIGAKVVKGIQIDSREGHPVVVSLYVFTDKRALVRSTTRVPFPLRRRCC